MTFWSRFTWAVAPCAIVVLASGCASWISGRSANTDLEVLQSVLSPLTEPLGSKYLVASAELHAMTIDSEWLALHRSELERYVGDDLTSMLADYRNRNIGGLLPAHLEGPRVRLVTREHLDRIFTQGDVLGGWRRFWATYPDSSAMIELSLPGYSKRKDRAILSYFISRGSTAGEAMVVLLHYDSRSWSVEWSEILFET